LGVGAVSKRVQAQSVRGNVVAVLALPLHKALT